MPAPWAPWLSELRLLVLPQSFCPPAGSLGEGWMIATVYTDLFVPLIGG